PAAEKALMVARLSRDLPAWVRTPITFASGQRHIRSRRAARDRRSPQLVKCTIYEQPSSPYLALLQHAGCEYGDFASLVAREGIEGALRALAGRGVYVTYDELKGRRPAIRGSATYRFAPSDFDAPGMKPHFVALTGGTRGQPS